MGSINKKRNKKTKKDFHTPKLHLIVTESTPGTRLDCPATGLGVNVTETLKPGKYSSHFVLPNG